MVRKIFVILYVITIVFVGCGKGEDNHIGLNSESENPNIYQNEVLGESSLLVDAISNVRIEIDNEKSSNTKIIVSAFNNSRTNTMFGEWFAIEKYENGVWYQIPIREDIEFNSTGYPVEPNATRELTFQFNDIYDLEAFQKYRIVTNFIDDNGDKHYVSDEFEIGILAN